MTCPTCGAANREGARFCDSCGAALATEPAREQRKVVTVLFCDASGSTALGERLDPEALRATMAAYFETARAAIERHGGTVEKFIGDAVMAVFGVPKVREDDALRAVRAAEELRDAVEIDVRIGVNTGEVVTGSGDTLVTGDAVNVAARLEQAAPSGDVLLGEETYRLVRDAVDAERLPPLEAKGKAAPLTAFRLRAVVGDVAVARRSDAPLVGREREMRLLEDAFARSRSERACALFTILGTAGVGKSRLAAEFTAGADATVVRGRCLSYGDGITYWPVVEVVLQLLAGDEPPNAALAALLGDGQVPADEITFAVRKLFEERAEQRPLVVVFDDVQWGEPTFLDLVEHVADWSREATILLLCLARADLLERRSGWGGGKLNATTVLLEPLSAAETDLLIDELLRGHDLEDSLRERIGAAAEGNPLFVEQMLAMLEESPGEVSVPATIHALLAARLDQLTAPERAALERGSVEGQVFHRGAVAALAPDDLNVSTHLLGLVRKELVRPSPATLPGDDAFRFRHLLIRDAAYDALPKTARAELHERFAAWLEERAPDLVELDEILGYHLEQAARYRAELGAPAGDLAARAARRLGAAGERAERRRDAAAAVSLLQRATGLLERDDPERLALLPALGKALYARGELEDCYRVLEEGIALGDADAAASCFFFNLFSEGHGESISPLEVEREAQAKLDEIGSVVGNATLAGGYLTLAWGHFWAGHIEAAIDAGDSALRYARLAEDRQLVRETLGVQTAAKVHGATPWSEIARHAAVMEEEGFDQFPLQGVVAAMQGRLEEARRLCDEFVRDQRERGNLVGAFSQGNPLGYFEMLAGEYGRADELLKESWDGLGSIGERGFRSTLGGQLGEVLARRGRLEEADAILDEADALGSPDDFATVTSVLVARALVASGRGDHDRAVELAREAVALGDEREYVTVQHNCWHVYGEVLLVAGRRDEARGAFERARDAAAVKGPSIQVDRAERSLAALAATPSGAPPA